ncbi:MAG TPA: tetratricopeptide repeat protein [Acetobacteraceae bacterium]|nr:tetratricopeptide repeat protein [Acetobacteraceae bacterium]
MRASQAKYLRAALPLLAVSFVAGCGMPGPFNADHTASADANRPSLRAARAAMMEGQAETALAIAHGVLVSQPNDVAALVDAGDADMQLGNRRTAEKEYRQALEASPSYLPARLGLGKLKMRDDIKGAEAEFRTVLASAPHDAAALTDLGVALDLQERHKEAQAAYTAAMISNPDLTSTRVDMGLSLALSGKPQQAEEMLRSAVESGPVPAKVRADLAVAEVIEGKKDDAALMLQADLSADEAKASVDALSALAPATKKN